MKRISLLLLLLCVSSLSFAQYYDATPNRTMHYSQYDSHNKLSGYTVSVNKSVTESNGVKKVTQDNIVYTVKDGKSKKFDHFPSLWTIDSRNATQTVNMEMGIKIGKMRMKGPMHIFPHSITQNTGLNDFSLSMSGKVALISFDCTMRIYGRKVVGLERITVPAGTFDCWKISEQEDIVAGSVDKAKSGNEKIEQRMSRVLWIAKNVGVVQTVNYDKDNKMQSFEKLESIK